MAAAPEFRVRWDRIDEQLLEVALRHQHGGTLIEAENRLGFGAVTLAEILDNKVGPAAPHFGPKTTLFARFVYDLFVGGSGPVEHPRFFAAKSVLLADVFEPPIPWGGTAYLSVWAEPEGQPVLVPFPFVPKVLLEQSSNRSFADSCFAYRALVADAVARVNLVAPAALMLAAQTPRVVD
jgi:hypothetical protein